MAAGLLQIVSEGELQAQDAVRANAAIPQEPQMTDLAAHLRKKWQEFHNHRTTLGIDTRLIRALQAYNGEYPASKLAEIRKFGGSEVHSKLVAVKCRAISALLRDIYLGHDNTWGIDPTPVPTLPDDIVGNVHRLVLSEVTAMSAAGQPIDVQQVQNRIHDLMEAAMKASVKHAKEEAKVAEKHIRDYLVEGGFDTAMAEFVVYLSIFQYAFIKGPVVENRWDVVWQNGQATSVLKPRMRWYAPNPINLYFTPGEVSIEDSEVIEKIKVSRAMLNSLIGLPGYNDSEIRGCLEDYQHGLVDFIEGIDSEAAMARAQENPNANRSSLLTGIEYHGPIQGKLLIQWGFSPQQIRDPLMDYHAVAWLIGRRVIKVHLNPNPRKRHDYFGTSFEKVPGAIIGHGPPEILEDVMDVANACFRSLVNNMSMASGPQVAVNEDRLAASTDADTIYPWKRWRFHTDPLANTAEKPIDFFQPNSNASELLGVYEKMTMMADEISGIPRYMTGSSKVGGAGSTASGLNMLIGNASKVLQMVASNIDKDVMEPLLQTLYDMLLLVDQSGTLRGDENIRVRGVAVAAKRETERMRKLEFLQLTGNPLDIGIIGPQGRAAILRYLADDLGMDGETVVPSDEEVAMLQRQQMLLGAAQAQGGQPQMSRNQNPRGRMGAETDNAQRTRNMQ